MPTSYYDTIFDKDSMATVTISPKFQVVIPKEIRERLNLRPGAKVEAVLDGDRVILIPLRDVRELRGYLRGIDTTVERDRDRT